LISEDGNFSRVLWRQRQSPRSKPAEATRRRQGTAMTGKSTPLRCDDGTSTRMATLLHGKATALHLVFTQCTTTCPIQGAIFEKVQGLLPDQTKHSVQLLSLSIDPEADTPEALHLWLQRFHGRPGWIAAAPRIDDLPAIRSFFGDGDRAVGNHITQVQIIDRNGALIWRTFDLPSPESIASMLRKIDV
jgi:protein SCO1